MSQLSAAEHCHIDFFLREKVLFKSTKIHPFVQYAKVTLLEISPCQCPIVKRLGVAYSCSYALLAASNDACRRKRVQSTQGQGTSVVTHTCTVLVQSMSMSTACATRCTPFPKIYSALQQIQTQPVLDLKLVKRNREREREGGGGGSAHFDSMSLRRLFS